MQRLQTLKSHLTNEKFSNIEVAPSDPIFGVAQKFKDDTDPKKVNMSVGVYRTDQGKPLIFKAVKEAERKIFNDPSIDKEYLPIEGHPKFNQLSQQLLFGNTVSDKITTVQTLSGTGALRIGAELLARHGPQDIYISKPTWPNHISIFENSGISVKRYPYWNAKNRDIDFKGMLSILENAAPGSIVLLHASAHNPTGCDINLQQWEVLADLIQAKQLYPFFDIAYQGFSNGDLDQDAFSIRLFARRGISFLVAQSFAKNIGLYGERIGALHAVCRSKQIAEKVNGQMKQVVRAIYSNPPIHGALIVATILDDPYLKQLWIQELKEVAGRIIAMRYSLKNELEKLGTPGDWSHIVKQIGMFSYTGLTKKQVEVMEKCHCFLMKTGRICMAGLNTGNVKYVAECICKAVTTA